VPFGEGLSSDPQAHAAWSGCITAMAGLDKRPQPVRLRCDAL
jgi:hypothetical protein